MEAFHFCHCLGSFLLFLSARSFSLFQSAVLAVSLFQSAVLCFFVGGSSRPCFHSAVLFLAVDNLDFISLLSLSLCFPIEALVII